jgi:hypothetical protein
MTEEQSPSNENDPASAAETDASPLLALSGGYSLTVARGEGPERLELRAKGGQMCLSIVLGPAGPSVQLDAASLSIATTGEMRLSAEDLVLEGRNRIAIASQGDMRLAAGGKLATSGFEQHIEATHGDVHVEANDDVRVDGERVRLNAPDAPLLRKPKPAEEP